MCKDRREVCKLKKKKKKRNERSHRATFHSSVYKNYARKQTKLYSKFPKEKEFERAEVDSSGEETF